MTLALILIEVAEWMALGSILIGVLYYLTPPFIRFGEFCVGLVIQPEEREPQVKAPLSILDPEFQYTNAAETSKPNYLREKFARIAAAMQGVPRMDDPEFLSGDDRPDYRQQLSGE